MLIGTSNSRADYEGEKEEVIATNVEDMVIEGEQLVMLHLQIVLILQMIADYKKGNEEIN